MESIFKLLKFIQPGIFIYWFVSKFINVAENQVYGIFYEITAIPFVLATVSIPIIIIVYWVKNKSKLAGRANLHFIFHLIFSILNIIIMTLNPAIF